MNFLRRSLLYKLALLGELVSPVAFSQPPPRPPVPDAYPTDDAMSSSQPAAGSSAARSIEAPQAIAAAGLLLPSNGPRCVTDGQRGSWLCLQGLRNVGTTLRAYMTYVQGADGIQLVKNPTLSLDGVPQRIVGANSIAKSGEPLSVLIVVKLVGNLSDAEVHSSLRVAVDNVISKAQKLPGSRIGLIGYNVRRANYQPNVELGDDAGLRTAAQLVPPVGVGLSFELFDALNEAVNRLEREPSERRRVLLVFTDGIEKDRDRERLFQQLAQRVARADVLVQVVMMPNREPQPYIRALADNTGGMTQVPQDGDGVTRAFGHLADTLLNQSVVTYELANPTTARLDSRQRHNIVLAYQGLSLSAAENILWPSAPAAQQPAGSQTQQNDRAPLDPSFVRTLFGGLVSVTAVAGLGLLLIELVRRRYRNGPQPEGTGNVFLLEGNAPKGAAGARAPVAAVPLFPTTRPGPMGRSAPLVVLWLYEVGRRRTHVVSRFPFSIGNDLDCDLVLKGVGGQVASCQICFDRQQILLRKWQGEPPQMNNKPVDGTMPVHGRSEFTVAGQLLVLFETTIA